MTLRDGPAEGHTVYLRGLAQVIGRALRQSARQAALSPRQSSTRVWGPQELLAEQGAGAPVRLCKDNLERVVMARLMEAPSEQWPVFYLVGCYGRVSDEFRAAGAARDPAAVHAVQAALLLAKQLAVSYTGLLLTLDLFPQARPPRPQLRCPPAPRALLPLRPGTPAGRLTGPARGQPPAAAARGALQLLDCLDAREGARGQAAAACRLPPQFLEDLAANLESEDRLDPVAVPLGALSGGWPHACSAGRRLPKPACLHAHACVRPLTVAAPAVAPAMRGPWRACGPLRDMATPAAPERCCRGAVREASRRLVGISPLGDFNAPLQILLQLLGVRQLARAAGRAAQWIPTGTRPGRSIQACPCLDAQRGASTQQAVTPACGAPCRRRACWGRRSACRRCRTGCHARRRT